MFCILCFVCCIFFIYCFVFFHFVFCIHILWYFVYVFVIVRSAFVQRCGTAVIALWDCFPQLLMHLKICICEYYLAGQRFVFVFVYLCICICEYYLDVGNWFLCCHTVGLLPAQSYPTRDITYRCICGFVFRYLYLWLGKTGSCRILSH